MPDVRGANFPRTAGAPFPSLFSTPIARPHDYLRAQGVDALADRLIALADLERFCWGERCRSIVWLTR
jgi:hypothetical protein